MIGWYVHHQGQGHLTRARTISALMAQPVTMLSSLPQVGSSSWVQLARDDGGAELDPSAQGLLHWAPLGHAGLGQRMAAVAGWIAQRRPKAMVVDVSVEITLLARLCGVPVLVIAGPGDREDAAHQLAYGLAQHIIAPWSRAVYDPQFLHAHRHKTSYVGAISRFDSLPPLVEPAGASAARTVLALSGAGGSSVQQADLAVAQQQMPGWSWRSAGGSGAWAEDIWHQLHSASVVVTHAGQNALAEVAAARRPAVVVAQPRPFDEQVRVAAALGSNRIAVSTPGWPEPAAWPGLIAAALKLGGLDWSRWSTGHGAQDAADIIDRMAMSP